MWEVVLMTKTRTKQEEQRDRAVVIGEQRERKGKKERERESLTKLTDRESVLTDLGRLRHLRTPTGP